ncbi:MAG: hypothetical protein LBG52_00795 [Candidatus Peribacteria bacterium]|jgi:hypothetical protein|nr:hypothetical protein [Candidatus Peribacteria bacterium]
MTENYFSIKIADLLNHLGSDTLEFSDLKTPLLPHLTETGLQGTLHLHSVDGKSILVCVEHLKGAVQETCESCGASFVRSLHIPEYRVKFTLDLDEQQESAEEVVLPINKKNNTINIEEVLYQTVKLQDPFVCRCKACETALLATDTEELEESSLI